MHWEKISRIMMVQNCAIIFSYKRCIPMKPYYEKLRELREGQDLKQSDVALVLGTTQQVYSRYENGINELPLRHLITLCGFYRVSADLILGLLESDE